MAQVNTVLGTISSDELGLTLIHEHLLTGFPGWECDALAVPYDREVISRACAQALEEAKAYGLQTMVDATPSDLARDVELQKMVSERSGINIICATGLYTEDSGKSAYFKSRGRSEDTTTHIYETFMKEITQGIGETGIKAGVIKVATGTGSISAYEQMVLKAAARAQKETGIPIVTHTSSGTMGPEQADLLIREGANPERIVIGHIGGNSNSEYHISALAKGVYIGFDRLGMFSEFRDTLMKVSIMGLVGIGHINRIMLSQDYTAYWLGRTPIRPDLSSNRSRSFSHIFRNIVPALKAGRMTDDQIDTMLVENPRRLFSTSPA